MNFLSHLPLHTILEPPPRPRWVTSQPFTFVGAWEPLHFRIRTGYGYTDEAESYYHHEFSDERLEQMCREGCSHVVLPFEKGFGLSALGAERDFIARTAERIRSFGMRVGLYIRCDYVVPDAIRSDYPDVDEWLAELPPSAAPATYGQQQQFRRKVSFTHPGTYRRLEDLFTTASREFDVDLLHLDGFHLAGRPEHACRSARSLAAYREWLSVALRADPSLAEIAHTIDAENATFPILTRAGLPTVAVGPEIKLWHRFLWEYEFAAVRHLRHFVHRLDPEIAVSANPYYLSWAPYYRSMSQRIEWYFDWLDAIWVEDHEHLQIDAGSDRVVSRLAAVTFARERALPVCHYQWWPDDARLEPSLAFTAASNGLHLSCTGFSYRYMPHFSLGYDTKRRYADWADRMYPRIGNERPAGETAVLRHAESLAWNSSTPWTGLRSATDLLAELHLPYRVVDRVPSSESTIRLLVLPDCECLSDAELAELRAWVESGGTLISTSRSGTHDPMRRRRPANAIRTWWSRPDSARDVDPREAYAWMAEDFPEYQTEEYASEIGGEPERITIGRGRVGYWPAAVPAAENGRSAQFARFIAEHTDELSIRVDAPTRLLVLLTAAEPDTAGARTLHLINVDPGAGPTTVTIVIRGYRVSESETSSPDQRPPALERAATDGVMGRAVVSGLHCYVAIRLLPI